MLNKKLPSISGVDALTFYAQRLTLINDDLYGISTIWKECEDRKEFKDDISIHQAATCNRRGEESPCESCIENKRISKEKKRLKAQFNKTVEKMLTFTPSEPVLCYKEKPTFTDIELSKTGGK